MLSMLDLHDRVHVGHEDRARDRWLTFVRKLTSPRTRSVTVGLTGKYAALRDAYASIDKALEHCSAHLSCEIEIRWIDTTDITDSNVASRLSTVDAVIVPGGFGTRGVEGMISCVRYCRENAVPYLGICLGMQVAVIEFARNVLGLKRAHSTEFDPGTPDPVVSELPEQKKIEGLGGSMRLGAQDVQIMPGTLAQFLFGGKTSIRQRFRHRYEVDPRYLEALEGAGLVFSGKHPKQPIMQIMELPTPSLDAGGGEIGREPGAPRIKHPYFIGGQFHPELLGRPLHPQPMFMGLVAAAIRRRQAMGSVGDPSSDWRQDSDVSRWIRSARPGVQAV
jgi:CTP synthase